VAVGEGSVSTEEVEDIVIELLAERHGMEAAELRERLQGLGELMPVDSVVMVTVLIAVEQRYGVRVAADEETARSLCSVREFAWVVAAAADKKG
jgi:acyl carrier protein